MIGIAAALAVGVIVLAFMWPAKTSTPQHLLVSISGPAPAVTVVQAGLAEKAPDLFDFVEATDRADAVAQIERRESYGAIVLPDVPGTAPEVLTAPAAGAAPAQLLTQIAAQLQAQASQAAAAAGLDPAAVKVQVTQIVPLAETDPTGAGLAAASFPLTIGGMIGGVLISFVVVGAGRRVAAIIGFGASVGLVLSLVLHTWFGFIPGDFWSTALVMGLSIAATASFIVGSVALLGRAGIALSVILTMFVGNTLSGAAMPWQFLLQPWGAIGQFFVPGAANELIRKVSYFPDADASMQWGILSAWAAPGTVLTLVGRAKPLAAAGASPAPAIATA